MMTTTTDIAPQGIVTNRYSQEYRRFVGGIPGELRSQFELTGLLLSAIDCGHRGFHDVNYPPQPNTALHYLEAVRRVQRDRSWNHAIPHAVDNFHEVL